MPELQNITAQSVWDRCLAFIKDNIQDQAYKTWFEPTHAVRLTDNALYIQVPSKFFYEWLEEHYVKLLKTALTKELGPGAKLLYNIKMENTGGDKIPFTEQIPSKNREAVQPQEVEAPFENRDPELKNPFVIPGINKVQIDSQLNSNYNFENFVEGDSNRLPRSAGKSVANRPGETSFNPFLVYGGVGLGKTHLAHAIGVEVKEKHPEKTVLYISAEVFSQQYQDAIRRKARIDFIHFYQLIDVLIIDDIQMLSGKTGTQEVFFHIFNYLHQNRKQVVLTSDKAPVDMQDIEARLLSRLKWGLTAEIQHPELETRVNIIKNILYRDGVTMSEEVIQYIAENVTSNVRELEGSVISLIAQASFNHREVTLDLAKTVVDKFVKNVKKEVSVDMIQKAVADYFKIDIDVLKSKSRKREIAQARQLAMFFAKKYTKNSLASIGAQIGNRDHATVLHACKTVDNLIETDKEFKKYAEEIKLKLSM